MSVNIAETFELLFNKNTSYISRSVLVSEFDGQTYRPKYHEDLVHSEIISYNKKGASEREPTAQQAAKQD